MNWNGISLLKRVKGLFGKNDVKRAFGVEPAVTGNMTEQVGLWCAMYENSAPWLGGRTKSLNLPAAVASELARLVTLELKTKVAGSARADFLHAQYAPVADGLRRWVELGCAKGGLVMKPYVANGKIAVDYVQADCFVPTAFDSSGNITGAVFADQIKRGGRIFTRLEYHQLADGMYTVRNAAFSGGGKGALGAAVPLSSVAEWAGLETKTVMANIERPLFSYFRPPQANTADVYSPLGCSVYARAVDLIKEADRQYSRLLWEFESGERAVYVSDLAFKKGVDGKPILPDRRLYRTLAVDDAGRKMFEDWSPQFRDAGLQNGLNVLLRKIEYNCGLAYGTLSDVQDVDKTAEEIRSSKQRSYSTVCDLQKALKTALEELVGAMDVLCTLYGLCPEGDYAVSFEFDDSIVADRRAEFAEKQQLVAAGIMQPWEFRMWYFGETEEQAKAACVPLAAETGAPEDAGQPSGGMKENEAAPADGAQKQSTSENQTG